MNNVRYCICFIDAIFIIITSRRLRRHTLSPLIYRLPPFTVYAGYGTRRATPGVADIAVVVYAYTLRRLRPRCYFIVTPRQLLLLFTGLIVIESDRQAMPPLILRLLLSYVVDVMSIR